VAHFVKEHQSIHNALLSANVRNEMLLMRCQQNEQLLGDREVHQKTRDDEHLSFEHELELNVQIEELKRENSKLLKYQAENEQLKKEIFDIKSKPSTSHSNLNDTIDALALEKAENEKLKREIFDIKSKPSTSYSDLTDTIDALTSERDKLKEIVSKYTKSE